jgi:hypothetical protein
MWQGKPGRAKAVHDEALLSALEAVAEQLRIPVTYAAIATEDLSGEGGLCVIRGERRIIVERSLSCRQKVRLLAAGLAQFDLEDVFILPVVREAIEAARLAGADFVLNVALDLERRIVPDAEAELEEGPSDVCESAYRLGPAGDALFPLSDGQERGF